MASVKAEQKNQRTKSSAADSFLLHKSRLSMNARYLKGQLKIATGQFQYYCFLSLKTVLAAGRNPGENR